MTGSSGGYTVELRNDVTDFPPHTFLVITGPDGSQSWGFAPSTQNSPFAPGKVFDNTGHNYTTTSGPIDITVDQYNALESYIAQSQSSPPYYNVAQGAECTAWAVQGLLVAGVIQPVTSPDLQPSDNSIAYNIFQTIVFSPYNGALHQAYAQISDQISADLAALGQYTQSFLADLFSQTNKSTVINNGDGSSVQINPTGADDGTIMFYDPSGAAAATLNEFVNPNGSAVCTIDDLGGSLWQSQVIDSNASGQPTSTTQYDDSGAVITTTFGGSQGPQSISEVDQENPDGTSQITTFTPTASITTYYTGSNGSGSITETDQENSNGTSQITTNNPDGSTTETYYSSPNGGGSVTEIDQENSNGTSQITIYNPDGSTTATTYAKPIGTGPVTKIDQENSDGTSQITTPNSDGTSTTRVYSGPNGTGAIIGTASTQNVVIYNYVGSPYDTFYDGSTPDPDSSPFAGSYEFGTIVIPQADLNGTAVSVNSVISASVSDGQIYLNSSSNISVRANVELDASGNIIVGGIGGGEQTTTDYYSIGTDLSGSSGRYDDAGDEALDGQYNYTAYSSSPGSWSAPQSEVALQVSTSQGSTQQLSGVLANSAMVSGGGAQRVTISGSGTVMATGVQTVPYLEVTPSSNLVLEGGSLFTDPVTVDADGNISGYGTITGDETVNGTITASGGTLDITGNVSGSGTLSFTSGATLQFEGSVAATEGLIFTGYNESLILGPSASVLASVSGLVSGDTIALEGQQATGVIYDQNENALAITASGGATYSINLLGAYQQNQFSLENGDVQIACYLAGTRIATLCGEVPVELLRIGDRLLTVSRVLKPIKWIGTRSYDGRFAARNPDIIPICISAGALADGVPHTDLSVSPQHAMYLDGVLVPAKLLVNGVTITRAYDTGPIHYFHIEFDQHDILIANGALSESFVDCDSRGLFHNEAEFAALYPHDVGPRWSFCAPRVEEGHKLESIRARLEIRAGLRKDGATNQCGPLMGFVDEASCEMVCGWAWQSEHPDQAVRLEVVVDGGVVAEVVANGPRPDVRAAGFGNGQCGFELIFAQPLPSFTSHEIQVRRISDAGELTYSPYILAASPALDVRAQEALSLAIEGHALAKSTIEELDQLINVLVTGTHKLLRTRARLHGFDLIKASRQRKRRGKSPIALVPAGNAGAGALALFIDDRMPTPDHDAGSAAVLDHMQSLMRLGFRVGFAPRDMTAKRAAVKALEAIGISCFAAPHYASVEQVLRQHQADIGIVYLHRVTNASFYGELVRQLCPRARIIYSVADLHFLRLGRQAALEGNPPAQSRKLREKELAAARLADVVVTHSSHEAALLRQMLPGLNVHTVPWSFTTRPTQVPFADRHGLAFIGSYDHHPNLDAAAFLIQQVMPRVWQRDPSIECLLVGDKMPERLRRLAGKGITVLGHVPDLGTVFDRVRVTVAPLRFGAGLKGKVLKSLAAGVPCVCTPIAAEGLALPAGLSMIVGHDLDELVAAIVRLHGDATENARTAAAGLDLMRERFQQQHIDDLMQAVVRPTKGMPIALSA